jgi:hypothetical protein
MKILIVTPCFPPQNAVASLRPYSWAKYWAKAGHEIVVYTIPSFGFFSNLDINLPNVKIYEIPIPFVQRFFLSYNNREKNKNINKNIFLKQKIITLIRNIYRAVSDHTGCILSLRYPDIRDFWAKKVIKQVSKDTFDFVITTGGPYSVHRVGYALKKKLPNIFWIVDWRDLWTQNPYFHGIRIFHWYEKYLEKLFHTRCNLITTVSDGLASDLQKVTSVPIEVIYNGFDSDDYAELLKKPRKKNKRFTIAYLGSLYKGFQDPMPLLHALAELDIEKKISSEDFEMIFAGTNCNIKEQIDELKMEKYYTYLGFIPREASLEIQYNADAVLFFEYGNLKVKGILTGKLFEYLSLSKEIWAIGISGITDAGMIIGKACAGICLGTDIEKIKAYIMYSIFHRNNKGREKDMVFISSFERRKQAEKLFSLLSIKK